MYGNNWGHMGSWGGGEWALFNTMPGWIPPLFLLLVAWSLVWKGLALWHASRRGEPLWFVIILVVNTAGILEIAYLFFVARLKLEELFSKKEHHRAQ